MIHTVKGFGIVNKVELDVFLEETQAGIKIARRNTNKLLHADDTTLMAESEEELKSLLMKGKEERERNRLKSQHSEN